MKKLKFYGYSDDTFGEYGVTNIDYDNCASGKPIRFKVTSDNQSIIITGQYGRNKGTGTWDVGVSMEDEDNCPDWYMKIYFEGYSTVLEVVVSNDFILECLENGEKWE